MSSLPDDRLTRLLGADELAPLRKRLRRWLGRAQPAAPAARFRVGDLCAHEHEVLAQLQGRSPRFSRSIEIDVARVDAALQRAGIAASLRDALERIDGPIVDLATERSRMWTRWSEVIDACSHTGLRDFFAEPAAAGLLKRLAIGDPATAAVLCANAQAVLAQLPARGLTRAALAARTLGDAHALDSGRPEATIVLAVLRRATETGGTAADDRGLQRDADAIGSPSIDLDVGNAADLDVGNLPSAVSRTVTSGRMTFGREPESSSTS